MKKRIVCFGPGPRFKGGISNYNTSLAKTLDQMEDTEVHIVSWTQQYPAIIPREFVDKSSKSDLLEGTDINVKYITNYNNPFSWHATYRYIRDLKPDVVIFQCAIAIQGLPLGRIVKWLMRDKSLEVILDLHFVFQKEGSLLDRIFTRWGIGRANTYIVHAEVTYDELKEFYKNRTFHQTKDGTRSTDGKQTVIKLYHPVYDIFKENPNFDVAAFKEKYNLKEHVFLFFGFIRKYKGLHQVIKAFKKVTEQRNDVSLLICGESFWQTLDNTKFSTKVKNFLFKIAKSIFLNKKADERNYRPLELIEELNIQDQTVLFNSFIPNEDVHKYFQASNAVVLYYTTSSPSGIELLSYNFKLPILATDVGYFMETIKEGYNGYLAKAGDIDDMAKTMIKQIEQPIPSENIVAVTKDLSWENYAKAILNFNKS